MSESLFRRLCEAHPASLQRLSYQYRMNGDVMALCNDLTYSGRLRCGNARVGAQRLVLPTPDAIPPPRSPSSPALVASSSAAAAAGGASGSRRTAGRAVSSPGAAAGVRRDHHPAGRAWQGKTPPRPPGGGRPRSSADAGLTPWLSEVLHPDRRVAFLDTDAISPDDGEEAGRGAAGGGVGRPPFAGLEVRSVAEAGEQRGGRGTLVNGVESDVVRLLAWGLDVAGFDLGGVGVISPYRSQVSALFRGEKVEKSFLFGTAYNSCSSLGAFLGRLVDAIDARGLQMSANE